MLRYTYTASGQKIRQQMIEDGRVGTQRDYAGPFVYINNQLAWINTPHGRVINKEGRDQGTFELIKEFHVRDHLGNTRIVLEETGSGTYTPTHVADYYPFGMEIQRGAEHIQPPAGNLLNNRYLYNGKEFQDDFGLNWYDYGARFYDAQIGRWHSVDPLAEKYYSTSPYAYVLNNPIIFIDPDGREVRFATQEEAEIAARELNEVHENQTNITVEERTRDVVKKEWWDIFGWFSETVTESYYALSTSDSDFDWSEHKYTMALFDIINSDEIIFNVRMVSGDTRLFGHPLNLSAYQAQGKMESRPGGGTVTVSKDGNRLNEKVGVVLMHELVGHGHPAGGNNAHSINNYYNRKLGLSLSGSRGIGHEGYHRRIGWTNEQINLFNKQ